MGGVDLSSQQQDKLAGKGSAMKRKQGGRRGWCEAADPTLTNTNNIHKNIVDTPFTHSTHTNVALDAKWPAVTTSISLTM
jgi:hypothetical protein